MARFSVVIGLLLCGLTVYGMVGSTSGKIATAFVPMMFGIPLVICGVVALNPHRRRLWMAMAAVVGGLGMIGAAARASFQMGEMVQGEATNLLALRVVIWMSLLCAAFVGIYIATAVHRVRRQLRTASPGRQGSPAAEDRADDTAENRVAETPQRSETPPSLDDGDRQSPAAGVQREADPTAATAEPVRSEAGGPAVHAGRCVDKRGQLHRI